MWCFYFYAKSFAQMFQVRRTDSANQLHVCVFILSSESNPPKIRLTRMSRNEIEGASEVSCTQRAKQQQKKISTSSMVKNLNDISRGAAVVMSVGSPLYYHRQHKTSALISCVLTAKIVPLLTQLRASFRGTAIPAGWRVVIFRAEGPRVHA